VFVRGGREHIKLDGMAPGPRHRIFGIPGLFPEPLSIHNLLNKLFAIFQRLLRWLKKVIRAGAA
jgi:hypothetical protein